MITPFFVMHVYLCVRLFVWRDSLLFLLSESYMSTGILLVVLKIIWWFGSGGSIDYKREYQLGLETTILVKQYTVRLQHCCWVSIRWPLERTRNWQLLSISNYGRGEARQLYDWVQICLVIWENRVLLSSHFSAHNLVRFQRSYQMGGWLRLVRNASKLRRLSSHL